MPLPLTANSSPRAGSIRPQARASKLAASLLLRRSVSQIGLAVILVLPYRIDEPGLRELLAMRDNWIRVEPLSVQVLALGLFGTVYMPPDRQPERFDLEDESVRRVSRASWRVPSARAPARPLAASRSPFD